MTSAPVVSVIVPVYNAGAVIRETIAAVRAQTMTDWELILVDDGSTDDSIAIIRDEIAREPASVSGVRMRLLQSEVRDKDSYRGPAGARNCGVDAALGRYIAFLDADDIWYPDKLSRQLEFMRENDAPFTFTSYVFGDAQAEPTRHVVHAPDSLDLEHALTRTVIFTSTVMLDRERIERRLLYMPYMESEDTACWWRILKSGIIARGLDEVLTVYRRPAHSLSSDKVSAVSRIWRLYREVAGLSAARSLKCMAGWATRATLRRVL